MAETNAEPSMEEILSSIKRIIAEDSEAALSGPRVKRSVGLTPISRAEAVSTDEQDDDAEILELTDPVAQDAAVEPEPVPAPMATMPRKAEKKPVLVSPATEEASRSSLASLSALVVKPEVVGSDTLEGLVREMLKPMLSEWLDAHLPAIVERQVAQEIARIAARG